MTDKISINAACMQEGERLQKHYGDEPIPAGVLINAVMDIAKCTYYSVLPGDRCYNRTNNGIWDGGTKFWNKKRLLISRGSGYQYVGPDYRYTGPIWHLTPDNVVAWSVDSQIVPSQSGHDFPDELPSGVAYPEGATKQIVVNAYERNRKARAACVDHYGAACIVCGFCFADFYGPMGDGYIHVHHLRDLATIGERYEVDPVADLNPVCPNCHAMLHTEQPAMTVEKLKAIIDEQRQIKMRRK